jgi:hypothetical protein
VVEPLEPGSEAVKNSRLGRICHADLSKALMRLL